MINYLSQLVRYLKSPSLSGAFSCRPAQSECLKVNRCEIFPSRVHVPGLFSILDDGLSVRNRSIVTRS